jgi:hypothetical protein
MREAHGILAELVFEPSSGEGETVVLTTVGFQYVVTSLVAGRGLKAASGESTSCSTQSVCGSGAP